MRAKKNILTKEERDVLILAAPHLNGHYLNNTEIGKHLGIPASRVKTIIHQICNKLEAHNRNEAIFIAIRRAIVSLNELYSLDELAELFGAFCPEMLRRVTQLVREELEDGHLEWKDEQIIRIDGGQDTILTRREQDVLALVGRGLTNREIADMLYISTSAVRTFLYRACNKLGTHKRAGAFVLALKRGEISIYDMYTLGDLIRLLAPLGAESLEKIAQILTRKPDQEPVPTGN